jgi:hypothetical protein
MSVLSQFARGQRIYGLYALSLLAPGRQLPVHVADKSEPKDISSWTGDELNLMIEEGRRQSDRQQNDLEQLRGRAQWLFTVAVASLAVLGSGFVSAGPSGLVAVLWLAGMLVLVYGVAGAAAIIVSRADFKMIHTAVLSAAQRPVAEKLAASYARMMAEGENTVATRLTVFRQAVVFCLCGGYAGLIAVLLST